MTVALPAMAVATCLGLGKAANAAGLFAGRRANTGTIAEELPAVTVPGLDCRNNRLLQALLDEGIAEAARAFPPHRVAVVIGTSTSGMAEGEAAWAERRRTGAWPQGFHYRQQEPGGPAAYVAQALGVTGPAYVIATACSSSAKVFASARRLIRLGLADAAVVGGADTLCRLTQAGFSALESASRTACNPFSANRDGITIGEGGALFLMTREPAEIALLGLGETSDAHHVSAPDPEGRGALAAMAAALAEAGLRPEDIAYLNLHGTATPLNDAMESKAVAALFPAGVPCSSTKALTGHTLGAAGAVEAAFLWLTLSRRWNPEGRLPPQVWDGVADPALPSLRLVGDERLQGRAALSNSFAFGGSNCALALGRTG